MILDLKNIKDDEEIALTHEYSPEREELNFDDCHYTQRILLNGHALRQTDTLKVWGQLRTVCALNCSRCLATFQVNVNEPFNFTFEIKGRKRLDITNDIRDQLIFLHQQQYLCQEACQGICSHCGINLNSGCCACVHDEKKKAFSKLKEFVNKKEDKEK